MSIDQFFSLADELHEKLQYSEAFSLFMSGAEKGDTSCMNRIASMYSSGEGVECDYDKALKWELNAIEHGDVTAMVNAGITYRIKGDLLKSKYWFEKALAKGDGSGALELAKLYRVSEKEIEHVKKYLEIAIHHESMSEACIEEAQNLLSEINENDL